MLPDNIKDNPLKQINVINLMNWFHCVLAFLNKILCTMIILVTIFMKLK